MAREQFENRSRAVSGDDGIYLETPREQLYLLIVCYRGQQWLFSAS